MRPHAVALSVPDSLVASSIVSSLGQLVVVALSVTDSLVAFFAVAFLGQLVVCVLGAVQGFLAVSSDYHSRVYLVIRLLAVLASLAEISHDPLRAYYVGKS